MHASPFLLRLEDAVSARNLNKMYSNVKSMSAGTANALNLVSVPLF